MEYREESLFPFIHGVVEKRVENGNVRVSRFTPQQVARLIWANPEKYEWRAKALSGVYLEFIANCSAFTLRIHSEGFCTSYETFIDVLEGGKPTYSQPTCLEPASHTLTYTLQKKGARIQVWFPIGMVATLCSLICDGELKPLESKRRVLSYGDSITQGWCCPHPSLAYAPRFAQKWDAECIDLGIGGYWFDGPFFAIPATFKPDLVTVAFGTNDHNRLEGDREKFRPRVKDAFHHLSVYHDIPVLCILPIWRSDRPEEECRLWNEVIATEAKPYSNVQVIDGFDLVPHDPSFFHDEVHPGDPGMTVFADNLYRKWRG